MFKWVVISFIIILAATYLWPIMAKSGKKTAQTLFDEDSEQKMVDDLTIRPPTNVVQIHRTNTDNPVDFPTQPANASVVVSETEHSLSNDGADKIA